MHIPLIKNYNNKFCAEFSPKVKEIFEKKLAEELQHHPEKEDELENIIKRMRYYYFPYDTYIISKSNNDKNSAYGRLKLQDTPCQILSDLLDTDIKTIEQNVKRMAIKKHQFFNITPEIIEKAKNIMDKYSK